MRLTKGELIEVHRGYWGQKFEETTDNGQKIWITQINQPHIRKGKEPHFGLNEQLIHNAIKERAIIQVEIQGREPFRVKPIWLKAYGKIHKEPSIVYSGKTFNIYLYPLPTKEEIPSF